MNKKIKLFLVLGLMLVGLSLGKKADAGVCVDSGGVCIDACSGSCEMSGYSSDSALAKYDNDCVDISSSCTTGFCCGRGQEGPTNLACACGSANGQSSAASPTSGLCTTGTASLVLLQVDYDSGKNYWTWNCEVNKKCDKKVSCSAEKSNGGGGDVPTGTSCQ